MKKEKFKNAILETIICLLYCFILCIFTYILKYESVFAGINIIITAIQDGKIFSYIVIPYIIMLTEFILIKSIVRDSFKSSIILTILTFIISIISFYKFKILGIPFIPSDILLVGNIGEIAKFGLTFPPIQIIVTIILSVLILWLYHEIRKKYYEKTKITLKTDWYRIPLFIIGIVLLYVICISPNRFDKLKTHNELENNYAWYGGNTTFFLHLGDFYTIAPNGYTKEDIEKIKGEIISEDKQDEENITETPSEDNPNKEVSNSVKPNIIMIMNESFTDPNKIKDATYSKNPLENITKLKEEDNKCIMGNLITPVDGGGTSLPEFEALTGMSSYYLQKQIFPYTSYIRKNMNSIVRTYLNNGYETVGVHTYKANFYNRKNVYKYLGFNKTIFAEDIDNPEIKGDYISDNEFANQIIKVFEETEKNKFVFGVTMQNHMPYENSRYSDGELEIEITSDTLTKEQKDELRTYVQGVYDGDKMYIKLVEYLKSIDEPTILIMFGDHRPAMSSEKIFESSIDTPADYYITPYIVWANYDIDYREEIFGFMSPSSLSLSIMKLANIEMPWYYKEFSKLYKEYPAINNQLAINRDYIIFNFNYIPKDDIIEKCEILQYDLLIKKKYIPVE